MEENEASNPGLWTNFTETTGFHGLNKVKFDKKYPGQVIRSVCWAVVWLASAAVLIYIITTELINYYSYPWISTTYIRLDQEAQFPVVTLSVCEGDTLDLSFTSFFFDGGSVNISDVPVVEYTDFTTYGMVDIGECTSRRFNANGKMLTRQHGKRSNLQIETRAKEIQIAVHTPREEPDMYSESITVGQDTDTYIEVHRREDIALPSPFISDGTMCQENYDYFDCNRKCWNELLKKQCGCTMNRSENGTHCVDTPADKACSDNLVTMESSAICLAACPPQCKVITYDVIVSSRAWNYGDDVPNMFIRIFLKNFKTTVTEQVPKYDGLMSLLANLGGQMGLFLGASILTITELLEFIIFIMWSLIQRRSKRNVVHNINTD